LSTWEIFDADVGPLSLFADRGMRRFWLRALLAPGVAMSWRQQALTLYRQHGAPIPNPRVLSKPLHGYLRRGLNPASRLSALAEHYRQFNSLMSPDCLRAFCASEPLELARLPSRKGSRFRLYLVNATAVQTQREGECTICLERDGGATILSRLTFNLFTIDGRVAVAIGGLQGPRSGHKREVIDATRDLFGLRPKDAALLVARAFAGGLPGAEVHAVSDALHVHRTQKFDPKLASYDAYWRERGAVAGGPLGFVLPPLGEFVPPRNGRDAAKLAILDGARGLLAAHLKSAAASIQSNEGRLRLA
jgi:uncharacterized protein